MVVWKQSCVHLRRGFATVKAKDFCGAIILKWLSSQTHKRKLDVMEPSVCVRACSYLAACLDLRLCAPMHTFVPFCASRRDLRHRPSWFAVGFAVRGTEGGSSPIGRGCCRSVLLLAGTRHLHHTLTVAGFVWRHAEKRPHTGFIEKPTHTT